MTAAVRSPCIGVCALDEQDICTGCQRTAREITLWSRLSEAERRQVLLLCESRARTQGLWFGKPID